MKVESLTRSALAAITAQRDAEGNAEDPEFVFSSDSYVAQDGWVLPPRACQLAEFLQNPTVYYDHQYHDSVPFPLGSAHSIVLGERVVTGRIKFSEAYDQARLVRDLIDEGHLRATSIRFDVLAWHRPTPAERIRYAIPDDADWARVADAWVPREVSVVGLPADKKALKRACDSGLVTVRIPDQRPSVVPPPAAPAAPTARSSSMNIRLFAQLLGISIAEGADDAAVRASVCQKLSLRADAPDSDITATITRTMGGIDQSRVSSDAVASERQRAAAIRALGAKHGLSAEAIEKMVNDGITIEAARGLVLDHLGQRGAVPAADFGHQRVDMSEKEKKRYSILRAISALVSGDWTKAGFEREVNIAVAKSVGRDARQHAFFMPTDLPFAPSREHAAALRTLGQQRAIYQVGTAAQGGNLVETELLAENFIDILRNMTVVSRLGATMLSGLVGNVDIPRRNGTSTAYWVAESGALGESEGTFDKVLLRPKTIGALSKMSRLMLLQSTPAIEMLAREDIMAVIALGIDLAALSGTGAGNQPTGIINQAGVGSVVGGTNGANLSFDHTIQLKTKPAVANSPLSQPGFALNSKSVGYLQTQKSTTGQYLWTPGGGVAGGLPNSLHGLPYQESQQLRSNLTKGSSSGICSELIYGSNWRDLLIGEWGVLEIMVNPFDSTGFANGDVIIRAFQTVDIACRHGESFSVMSDALTPGF